MSRSQKQLPTAKACLAILLALSAGTCCRAGLAVLTYDSSGSVVAVADFALQSLVLKAGPVDRVVAPGEQAAFSVLASGNPPLHYQWYFNTSNLIPKATNDSYVIPSVSISDFGSYSVVVTDSLGAQITSQPAQLWLDSDGDGLPDVWEIANFGSITNQNGAMDFDGDGISNLQEFRDGTSPTTTSSLLPRLYTRSPGGQILQSPNNDPYSKGANVALTALPDPGLTFLCWSGDASGTNNPTSITMDKDKFVQATFGLPLGAVLDVTNVFTTGGDGGWYGQTGDSHDGVSSARSALVVVHPGTGSSSWMQTTLTTAKDGTVSFWWRSDNSTGNSVTFFVDGVQRDFLNGFTSWQQATHFLAAGTHTLKWVYSHLVETWSTDSLLYPPKDTVYVDQVVIDEYADPNYDSDGDGLPDLWEYKYFDTLTYGATDDPDGDGVGNLAEYIDVTLPNSASSVKPRLTYVIEGGGTAVANPALAEYSYGQKVTNTASISPGWSFVGWRGPFTTQTAATYSTNNPSTIQLLTSQTVHAIFGLPLPTVTDQPALTWTTGGEMGWYGETNVTHDGTSAARSAAVGSSGESWMETTVQGPGTLAFWWKVDSSTNSDQLNFLINSNTQPGGISGVVDWQLQSYLLGAGPQKLRWRFNRYYGTDTNRLGAGWVDQVQFAAGYTLPVFLVQPQGQTVMQVSNAVVQVLAAGTPTISYQLYHGATPYGLPTTGTTLTITNPPPSFAGTWTVQASNGGGTTPSDPFTLGVIPAPPSNDNFVNAYTLASYGPVAGYNFAATKESGEPDHGGYSGGASVWWKWTAPQTGRYHVIVQDTNQYDGPVVGVYSGSAVNALTPQGTTVFGWTNPPVGDQLQFAETTFDATGGTTYAIAVDSTIGYGIWFGLWLEYVPPPINDMFANRTTLTGASASDSAQLDLATAEPGEPAHDLFPAANSVWWTWTAPRSGGVIVNVGSSKIIPRVAVYTGSVLTSLHQVVAGFGGTTNLATIVTFNASAGTAYQIAVDGFFGSVGDVELNVALNTPSFVYPTVDASGNLNFSVDGPAGSRFEIDASDDLKTWSTIYVGTIPASGVFNFQTSIPPGSTARFYRVLLH